MTVIVEDTRDNRPAPVFTGRIRWVAALLVTVGAALQVAEFLLEPGSDTTASRVAWWVAHPDRIEWSKAAGLLAVPFLLGQVYVTVTIARRHSRRIATAAAVCLTAAMTGLAAIQGAELAALFATRAGHQDAAIAILDSSEPTVPGVLLLVMFLGGALIGTVLINIALWRSPYAPRLVVIFGVTFVVLDIVLQQGVAGHLAALAAGLVLAWAIVTGYVRTPRQRERVRAH
ncbi:hypothetical protein FB561_6271 [Kribbella amoyensis]|uniref:DUF4386 family protein n=1 Tax=Kribbella amoyensis TaxID=996641 RepID=A0A561B7T0_9ACTN|nr:hypothetical protein [Kribbella amoyensis]TWD74837.1 hypothetical protein FB561_6271 [Kribbella amoyensis]